MNSPSQVFTARVLTVSDRCARGERVDESGPLLVRRLGELGYRVLGLELVCDGEEEVAAKLEEICGRADAQLVVTTGGSGVAARDQTPEGTLRVAQRVVPGLMEHARRVCARITPLACLSRGVAVLAGSSLIVNLPGHPKAALETLEAMNVLLAHALKVMASSSDCPQTGRSGVGDSA